MWGLAPSPPRRASPPALRPVVNTSMASRAPEPPIEEPANKYPSPTVASITESLSLLGVNPETVAISLGESLADRYLTWLGPLQAERPLDLLAGCFPRRPPVGEPSMQLFSNDFMEYLNQIA